MITQEAVTAEINYRLERAQAAALARQVRQNRPSRVRRWFTRPAPALRLRVRHDAVG